MKKILALMLLGCILLCLAACGDNSSINTDSLGGTSTSPEDVSITDTANGAFQSGTIENTVIDTNITGGNTTVTTENNGGNTETSDTDTSTTSTSPGDTDVSSTAASTNNSGDSTNTGNSTDAGFSTDSNKPSHTHSYSKVTTVPTCTEKGYTTYTCSCGDAYVGDYTDATHSFSQYLCDNCGIHDKEHTYEFLIEFVKECGKPFATTISLDVFGDGSVYLAYNAATQRLYIYSEKQTDIGWMYSAIYLDTFFYGVTVEDYFEVTGYLDAINYTSGAPITDFNYSGPVEVKYHAIEYARICNAYLVSVLNDIATQSEEWQLTMEDIGFSSYSK